MLLTQLLNTMQIKMMASPCKNDLMHFSTNASNNQTSIYQNQTMRKKLACVTTTAKSRVPAIINASMVANTVLDSSMVLALISMLIEDSIMILMNALNARIFSK